MTETHEQSKRTKATDAHIARLEVADFKSLKSIEVDFGQVNVFIGANGSGKSNLLERSASSVPLRPAASTIRRS